MDALIFAAVLIIGYTAGLRALTPPAVIAWAAYLGYIDLHSTSLSFTGSLIAVGIFSLLAVGEYIGDMLPTTPARTAAPGLIARVLTGSFSAACILMATNQAIFYFVVGGIMAIVGAYSGYYLRTGTVRRLGIRDAFAAITEDVVAICLAIAAVAMV